MTWSNPALRSGKCVRTHRVISRDTLENWVDYNYTETFRGAWLIPSRNQHRYWYVHPEKEVRNSQSDGGKLSNVNISADSRISQWESHRLGKEQEGSYDSVAMEQWQLYKYTCSSCAHRAPVYLSLSLCWGLLTLFCHQAKSWIFPTIFRPGKAPFAQALPCFL